MPAEKRSASAWCSGRPLTDHGMAKKREIQCIEEKTAAGVPRYVAQDDCRAVGSTELVGFDFGKVSNINIVDDTTAIPSLDAMGGAHTVGIEAKRRAGGTVTCRPGRQRRLQPATLGITRKTIATGTSAIRSAGPEARTSSVREKAAGRKKGRR